MEDNDVKSACGGTRLEFEVQQDGKTLIQNPTGRKNLY